jgi:hypothetical protein
VARPWDGSSQAGRGFDQRAIHREVLIAQQVQPIGLHDHLVEELATDVRVQQPIAVPGERGVVETGFDHIHIQKPSEAQVIVECLAEGALAADREQAHQQTRLQQSFGWNGRPPIPVGGVQLIELRRELGQGRVGKLFDRP